MSRKRHDYIRGDGSEVPRPFDKWLVAVFIPQSWRNRHPGTSWAAELRRLAEKWRCGLKIDPRWSWLESAYCLDYEKKGPCLLVGGRGTDAEVCTAALHELGHHILHATHQNRADRVADEEAAWLVAIGLAAEHRFPFAPDLPRRMLYSYRRGRELRLNAGSGQRTRRPKRTTIDRLQGSRRTAQATRTGQCRPLGKKGKRRFKKETKQRVARFERRAGDCRLEGE